MDSINVLVTANKVEWKFIPDVVYKWKTTYAAKPFIMDCDFTIVNGINEQKINTNGFSFYPNPTNDIINFKEEIYDAEVINLSGQIIIAKIKSTKSIDTRGLANGIYFIRSRGVSLKFIVQH